MSNKIVTNGKAKPIRLSAQTFSRVFNIKKLMEEKRGVTVFANTVVTEALDLLEKKEGK